jgi:HD-GYP domain-containing protein (c-di-GMP phosphodiesterase class II)
MEMIERIRGIPQVARDMIMTHHERITGRGYPQGLQGDQIPLCGRIAAIVDCYDAMISKRPYQEAMAPTEALHVLYQWRNVDFNEYLIEQFIQCLGAYPTGTVVELSSGQIGIVVSQNRVKRPYPRVKVIINPDREHCKPAPVIDLREYASRPGAGALEIKRPLSPGTIGINPADYCL